MTQTLPLAPGPVPLQIADGTTVMTLENGLRVVVVEDRAAPAVTTFLAYGVGTRDEREGELELAHFAEHLMFEGTPATGGRGAHAHHVVTAGGTVDATTLADLTIYYATIPPHAYELMLWLEAERLVDLIITEEGLEAQREVVRNEHRQRRENTPYGSWQDATHELLFPKGHPYYATPTGRLDDLAAASLTSVRDFLDLHYHPRNAVLAVTGNVDTTRALDGAARYLGAAPDRGPLPVRPTAALGPLGAPVRRRIVDRVSAARRFVSWRAPAEGSPGLDALHVALAVLAIGSGSRLHQRLVEELGVASSVNGGLEPLVGGNSVATVNVTTTSPAELARAEAVLEEELLRLATEQVTAQELDRALAMLERLSLDRSTGLWQSMKPARSLLLHGDALYAAGEVARLLEVTAEGVRHTASTWLRPEAAAVVDIVPRSA